MREKILYITAYVPHRAAAGEKNTMLMLNDLAQIYDVDLIYFKYKKEDFYKPETSNIRVLKVFRNSNTIKLWGIANLPFLHPVYSIRFSWFKFIFFYRLIKKYKYKAIVLNHSNVFIYGKFLDKKIPKILFAHDVIIQRALRSSGKLMQFICKQSEKMCFKIPNSHIFSFSQKDVDIIKHEYNISAKVCLDYIDPNIINKTIDRIDDYYMFFGDWSRKENYEGAIWFIEHISPLIKEKTIVKIVGRRFPVERIKNTNPLVHYEVMGFVDDPYDILSKAKALISPLFKGAGIKVKVIESLACGTPVIGTAIAFEGLPKDFKSFMLTANTPQEYVNSMGKIPQNINKRRDLKERFIKYYSQDSIVKYIETLNNKHIQ